MTRRRTQIVRLASLVVALAGACGSAHAVNLITNGSFESPTVSTTSLLLAIPGWTRVCGSFIEVQGQVIGWTASDGTQWWEADGVDNTCINQTVTTLPNGQYQLSLAFSPRPGVVDNRVTLFWNGTPLTTFNASGAGLTNTQWTLFSFTVTAPSSTGTIELRGTGTSDALGGLIDNVKLEFIGCKPFCPGDADGDGDRDFADITAVLASFGQPCFFEP